MPTSVILIIANAHGGSTITNIVLGQHPKIFSTGTLRDFPTNGQLTKENDCSCGANSLECPFWTEVSNKLKEKQAGNLSGSKLFESISQISGKNYITDVDHGLKRIVELAKEENIRLYVLYSQRSLRGVLYSVIRKCRERGEFKRPIIDFLKRSFYLGRSWYLHDKLSSDLCSHLDIPYLKIQYEELCKRPNKIMNVIENFIYVDISDSLIRADRKLDMPPHLIRGNQKLRSKSEIVLELDTRFRSKYSLIERILSSIGLYLTVIEYKLNWRKKINKVIKEVQ